MIHHRSTLRRAACLFCIFVLAALTASCSGGPTKAPPPTLPPLTATPTETASAETQATATTAATDTPMAEPTPSETEEPPGLGLAAMVNGQPILLVDYNREVERREQALEALGVDESGQTPEQLEQARMQVLESMINQVLIEQAAAEMGVTVSDEEVEAQIEADAAQSTVPLEEWLSDNGLTLDEYRERLRSEMVALRLSEHVTADMPETAEQVYARHILVSDEAKAQELYEQLEAGADFASLAMQFSEDQGTAQNGGDLGWFPRGLALMPPEVEEAAFSLSPGEHSGVIKSSLGYHLLLVEAHEMEQPLEPGVLQMMMRKTFDDWLKERREQSEIERYL